MKYTQGKYIITEKKAIAREIYSFTILCPEVAQVASPGQFVHIRANGFTLRRPISICGIDKEKGTLRIVFEVGEREQPSLQGSMRANLLICLHLSVTALPLTEILTR